PVSVVAQIAVLSALNAGLFDAVALADMPRAEAAVQGAAGRLDKALVDRLEGGDALADADRQALTESARQALSSLAAAPVPNPST
ncbi:MAG: synthase subunit alpha, partial [Rhizobacter sp.]|nr:synthase subunit alpha [Rhizobacter sp.]